MHRISPEAPVPVVSVSGRTTVLSGAGNVAANVTALGAAVGVTGLVGTDQEGDQLRRLLLVLSTSRSSPNVLPALRIAHRLDCCTIGLTGAPGASG